MAQLAVGLLIGMGMGIGMIAFDWPDNIFDSYEFVINLIAISAGIGAGFAVLKYLDRAPREQTDAGPPPPPTFS